MTAFQAVGRGSIPRARSNFSIASCSPGVKMQLVRLIATVLACATALVVLPAEAKPRATFQVLPRQPKDGGPVTLVGTNLNADSFYTLLLAVPDVHRPLAERLFGPVKTDASGRLNIRMHLPAVTHCGKASVYAYGTLAAPLRSVITLTTCTIKGGAIKLPQPPSGGKKKH